MRLQLPSSLRAFTHEFSKSALEGPKVFFLPLCGAVDGTIDALRRWDGKPKGAIRLYIAPIVGATSAIRTWLNEER